VKSQDLRRHGDLPFPVEACVAPCSVGVEAAKTGPYSSRPALVGPGPLRPTASLIGKAEHGAGGDTPQTMVNGWAGRDLEPQIGPRRWPSRRRP